MRDPDSTISVWHAGDNRDIERAIWETDTPGLVIQQSISDDDLYCVTHERSGLVVAIPPCGCFVAAEFAATLLYDCGDWDRPGAEIFDDKTMRDAAKALLSEMGSRAGAPVSTDIEMAKQVRSEAMQR